MVRRPAPARQARRSEELVLVSHATFHHRHDNRAVGRPLLGLVWGARLSQERRSVRPARDRGRSLDEGAQPGIIWTCSQGTARGTIIADDVCVARSWCGAVFAA